ncbi:MAG: hypothetical protein WC764_02040 [Candidatus Paceibacterota bacterium]|jgi:hypothetical protein
MKKQNLETHQILIIKLFFILSVIVIFAFTGWAYWLMVNANRVSPVPVVTETVTPTQPDTKVEIPSSSEVTLCGIAITLPEFSIGSLGKDLDGCLYRDDKLSIQVIDKGTSTQDAFTAFDRYLNTQLAKEIISIARTDSESDNFILRTFYNQLEKNSVAYTAELGQDKLGAGVYQTATYLDGRYIVYLTYHLFDQYDNGQPFRTYTKEYVSRPEVQSVIKELNASTRTIRVAQ